MRRAWRSAFACLSLAVLLATAQLAMAHGGKPTIVELRPGRDGTRIQVILFDQDLQRVHPGYSALDGADLEVADQAWSALQDYLAQHLQIRVGADTCLVHWRPRGHLADGRRVVEGQTTCRLSGPVRVRSTLFTEVDSQHRTLLVMRRGERPQAWTLSARAPEAEMSLYATTIELLRRFLTDGVAHILSGADHVLFVIGLLLLAGGFNRRLLLAVSGFTVAHTLTLALAAFGRLHVPPGIVEPVIGASIAYVGFETLWRQAGFAPAGLLTIVLAHLGLLAAVAGGVLQFPVWTLLGLTWFVIGYGQWLRRVPDQGHVVRFAWLPFVFGLAHGLGFAGPLLDLHLRDQDMVVALLAFNAGVELGQLAVIAAVVATVAAAARVRPWPDRWRTRTVAAVCTVLIATGAWWFIERTLP